MRAREIAGAMAVAAAFAVAAPAAAQDAEMPQPLEVGDVAPDFSIPGATRHGVLAESVTLSEYAGKTVVLSFFFRARTRG